MQSFQDINNHFDGFGSPDGLGATVRMGGFGDDAVAPAQPVEAFTENPALKTFKLVYGLAGIAGTAIGAYHGYKRNDSIGWAIGWALLGGIFPIIVIPVAFAQGLGEEK